MKSIMNSWLCLLDFVTPLLPSKASWIKLSKLIFEFLSLFSLMTSSSTIQIGNPIFNMLQKSYISFKIIACLSKNPSVPLEYMKCNIWVILWVVMVWGLIPKKKKSMQEWPPPKTLKNLKGFLGLTRYYRTIIRNLGKIVGPLTGLLKKMLLAGMTLLNKHSFP